MAAGPVSAIAAVVPIVVQTGHPVATPRQLWELAEEYRQAAELLEGRGRTNGPHSLAPFRLAAIHGLELYLSAFLLSAGQTPEVIRAHGHNLATRSEQATPLGLVLRQRTLQHLAQLTDTREYLMSRYAADSALNRTLSQPNRLAATLREVSYKVTLKIAPSGH